MFRRVILPILLTTLVGCATTAEYPGPRTEANSKVTILASGIQKSEGYSGGKLIVIIFQGKDKQAKELGRFMLTPDLLSNSLKLDQGVEYSIVLSSIEPHLGGFSSCGFSTVVAPVKGDEFKIAYETQKNICDLTVTQVDLKGKTSTPYRASSFPGGVPFTPDEIPD